MSCGRFAELLLPLSVSRAIAKLMKTLLSPMYFRRFLISVKYGCQHRILTSVKHGKDQAN
jgi:hypothetical protein